MTVGEMLKRMDSPEITEWKILYQIERSERDAASGKGSRTTFG